MSLQNRTAAEGSCGGFCGSCHPVSGIIQLEVIPQHFNYSTSDDIPEDEIKYGDYSSNYYSEDYTGLIDGSNHNTKVLNESDVIKLTNNQAPIEPNSNNSSVNRMENNEVIQVNHENDAFGIQKLYSDNKDSTQHVHQNKNSDYNSNYQKDFESNRYKLNVYNSEEKYNSDTYDSRNDENVHDDQDSQYYSNFYEIHNGEEHSKSHFKNNNDFYSHENSKFDNYETQINFNLPEADTTTFEPG